MMLQLLNDEKLMAMIKDAIEKALPIDDSCVTRNLRSLVRKEKLNKEMLHILKYIENKSQSDILIK